MGMFDYICGNITCPHCNKKTYITEQIKWLPYEERALKYYYVGDNICVTDGVYHHGSLVRSQLYGICEFCNTKFPFKVVIKDKKIDHFEYDESMSDVVE